MSAGPPAYGLGRLFAPDPRDRRYPLTAVAPGTATRSRYWSARFVLDQGQTPQCVAYALTTALIAGPITDGARLRDPALPAWLTALYAEAQQDDEIPGPPPPYDGTSVRGGCKALQDRGLISTYRWAASAEEVASALVNVGPVVVGSIWTQAMFTPDTAGQLHPSGPVVGGHAYCLIGYDHPRRRVRLLNSWGRRWGQRGRAWLALDDLRTLLERDGEAAVLTEEPHG